jgi:hypothetical protein
MQGVCYHGEDKNVIEMLDFEYLKIEYAAFSEDKK